MSVSLLPSMVGLLSTGFLADTIGIGNTFIIGGGLVGMIGLFSFATPAIKELKKGFDK